MEIFTEGLSVLAQGQEVNSAVASSETELWTRYIGWCEERQQDKNVSEALRKKVSGQIYIIVFFAIFYKLCYS